MELAMAAGHFHWSTGLVLVRTSPGLVLINNELISCYGNVMWENFGEEKL